MKVTGTDGKEYTMEPEANLTDADLSSADLSKADLGGVDLEYDNLSEANLRDANLSGAIWSDVTRLSFQKGLRFLIRIRKPFFDF